MGLQSWNETPEISFKNFGNSGLKTFRDFFGRRQRSADPRGRPEAARADPSIPDRPQIRAAAVHAREADGNGRLREE